MTLRSKTAAGLSVLPLLALLCTGNVARAEQPPSAARATVERLDAVYLDVMKQATKLGYDGRFKKLAPTLKQCFDFGVMARLSIGSRWKDLTPAQQDQLTATFGKLSIATYAGRFTGYSGERFEILGDEPGTQSTVLVRTRVIVPEKDPVQLDYRLRQGADGWRIIDVFMNGTVSELALRRSEYTAILDRDGFDGLITALDEKIAKFSVPTPPVAER